MKNIDLNLELETGGTINVIGHDLATDDITNLQTAVDSLNPVNLEEVKAILSG
jgi:hypothetical protein